MELAHGGFPLVDPGTALLPVALGGAAPVQIAGGADFEDGVVAAVEDEAEAAGVGFARGGGHDAGVEDGDQGARGEFPEAGVGGCEEVEVEGPGEVCEGEDHEFAAGVLFACGGFGG